MGIYFFWGEDNFRIIQTIQKLKKKVITPEWIQFNYHKIHEENTYSILEALNQVMTPVLGTGEKLIWLEGSSILQQCSDDIFTKIEPFIAAIPNDSNFVLTSSKRPNKKLKSTKLFEKYADMREFSLILPWKIDELITKAQQFSEEIGVNLSSSALNLLVESVGNDTRLLWNELEKLSLYNYEKEKPVSKDTVSSIVNIGNYSSLQLAKAISQGNKEKALEITIKLLSYNAEVSNPNRLFFLRKEIKNIKSEDLLEAFPILLDLENNLKKGYDSEKILKNKILELCILFS